jgi:hypothetical protein
MQYRGIVLAHLRRFRGHRNHFSLRRGRTDLYSGVLTRTTGSGTSQLRKDVPYVSRDFQRFHASSRAFLLASGASGASPERMKPWVAPS